MSVSEKIVQLSTRRMTTSRSDLDLPPDKIIANMASEGQVFPTGFLPLDREFRCGGLPPGRILVVGGAPFSGKTTLVLQIAHQLALSTLVLGLFSDEGRNQAAVRLAVMAGISLDLIDKDPTTAAAQLAHTYGERSLLLRAPDTDSANLDDLCSTAAKLNSSGAPSVIVLDSIQSIALAHINGSDSRTTIRNFMSSLRTIADSSQNLFLLTSQSNRASYRSKRKEDNSQAIAAFAESNAIEYYADVAIVMDVPDDSGTIHAHIAKNRLLGPNPNPKNSFSVRYDPTRGTLCEVDDSSQDSTSDTPRAEAAIKAALKTHRDGLLAGALLELAGRGFRKSLYFAARQNLLDNHSVFAQPQAAGRVLYKLTLSDDA